MNPAILVLPSILFALPLQVHANEIISTSRQTVEGELQHFGLHDEKFEQVIRGQAPQTYDMGPGSGAGQQQVPSFDPNQNSFSDSGQYFADLQSPMGYDPFMSSPYAGATGDPYSGQFGFGVVGPQPVRLGWSTRYDFKYISDSDISPSPGGNSSLTVYEYDLAFDYVTQAANGWTWKFSPEVTFTDNNFKNIEATRLSMATQNGLSDISDNYYRIGYRMEATSPQAGPFSWRLGFTPAIASDFERQLNSEAWNFDADATTFFRTSPNLMFVAGILYWDRAEDHILPNAGLVWTPNQFWEIRATYPKSRAEVFVGTPFGIATWLYAGAEYDIQSWQAGEVDGTDPQLQAEQWQAFAGFRWEACAWESYLDFGYVFDRKYSMHGLSSVVPLHPEEGFMVRYGVLF